MSISITKPRICRLLFVCLLIFSSFPSFAKDKICDLHQSHEPLSEAAACIFPAAKKHRLFIVGEIHGTQQIPALTSDLIRIVAAHQPVRVGLEIPQSSELKIHDFIMSEGSPSDLAMLKSIDFWKFPDGRATKATLGLIESLRSLHAKGYDVDFFAMEPTYPNPGSATYVLKERGMAKAISKVLRDTSSSTVVVSLMGSYHARYGKVRFNARTPSVTERLKKFHPIVLFVSARSTNAWNCIDHNCGIHEYKSLIPSNITLPALNEQAETKPVTVFNLLLQRLSASVPIGPTYH